MKRLLIAKLPVLATLALLAAHVAPATSKGW
jgi:hypothetical protein